MNARQAKRLIPLALAVAVALQSLPAMMPGTWTSSAGFADEKADLKLKPRVKLPELVAAPKTEAQAPSFAMQQLDESDRNLASATHPKALQGSVTNIHVTRGRSQIIKFAQPIMRMSIAEPTLADLIPLSPDQVMINGKLRGVTSLIVWDENGQEGIFDLYVQNDTSELMDAVNAIAPSEKIQARVTDDSFILSGQVSNSVVLDEIRKTAAAYGYRDDKFIDLTETPVPQVMLEVRIAEANRSISRQLKTAYQYHSSTGGLNVVRLANPIDGSFLSNIKRATGGLTPNAFGALSVIQGGSNAGGTTGSFTPFRNLSVMWDMLETAGQVNTLANPTLVCTHGRTASFLAGGQFPFVGSVDQNGSPIVQFKDFGVKLDFTPWIAMRSRRIELKVAPEVSNLDTSNCIQTKGNPVCGILQRKTDTTVELMDGETLMISGILSREEQNTFAQVPFIASIPVLGNMFKSPSMNRADRELVVIITPHIVNPSDYGKVLGTVQ